MELEEVKSHYRNKITEMEAAAKRQERKGYLVILGAFDRPGNCHNVLCCTWSCTYERDTSSSIIEKRNVINSTSSSNVGNISTNAA